MFALVQKNHANKWMLVPAVFGLCSLTLESGLNAESDSTFGKVPITVSLATTFPQVTPSMSIEKLSPRQLPRPVEKQKPYLYVYSGKRSSFSHYVPSGWMGDYGDIHLSDTYMETPSHSRTCLKLTYTGDETQGYGWAGIYWQNPGNNWGNLAGGYDLRGMRRLTFWARGAKGGEKIAAFKVGGIEGDYSDSDSAQIGPIQLSSEWTQYTIDLTNVDLSRVIGGFAWAAGSRDNPGPITFYLDQIRYER